MYYYMNLISWKILTVATLGVSIPWLPANSLTPPPTHATTYVSQSSQPMFTFKEPARVPAIIISADGKKLIGGSFGQLVNKDSAINTLKLWELGTGKLLRDFTQNTDSIESIVLTADGGTMITGNFNGKIKFWNWRTGKLISTMRGDTNSVEAIAISPNQKFLASSSEDGTIRIWQLP
jgi:COMPASS component SWD3